MGFACQGLWVTGYCGLMGYGLQIPAHQLGGPKMAWDFRGYGLSKAWVKRVSTVSEFVFRVFLPYAHHLLSHLLWSILHDPGLVWIPSHSVKVLHKTRYKTVSLLWR